VLGPPCSGFKTGLTNLHSSSAAIGVEAEFAATVSVSVLAVAPTGR
jgi:hypothetical protein